VFNCVRKLLFGHINFSDAVFKPNADALFAAPVFVPVLLSIANKASQEKATF